MPCGDLRHRERHGNFVLTRPMTSPLRLAAQDDLDLLVAMIGEFYAESGYALDAVRARDAFARLLGDETLGRVWLVRDGDEDVGYIALTLGFSLEYYGRDAFIDDFYIRVEHRGRGLGTRVLHAIDSECRALGINAVHLEAERTNAPAQSVYRKNGFTDNDRQLLTKRIDR